MKPALVAALVAVQVVGTVDVASADSGWVRDRHGAWVEYHFTFHHPRGMLGAPLAAAFRLQRHEAAVHARRAHRAYLHQLARAKRLLAQARASIAAAQFMIGFPAICVANAEEGGHNSTAGYFGFIYPPASYGPVAAGLAQTYGSSWLNWPWSAQLQVALDLFRRYGGSAWGPLTRAKCGI